MILDTSQILQKKLAYDAELVTPITNIMASNGSFQVRTTPLMTTIVQDNTLFNDLPAMNEGVVLHIPKLPFSIFEYIGAFFRYIYKKEKTESAMMVFYDPKTDSFTLWAPLQKISSANVKYQRDDDPEYTTMCQENILVMVAHSHPWPGAGAPGPSGTDNNDEKESLIYMILGNVEHVPTYTLSTCPNGKRIPLNFQSVFSMPSDISREEKINLLKKSGIKQDLLFNVFINNATDEEINEYFEENVDSNLIIPTLYNADDKEIPDEWVKRCSKETYASTYVYPKNVHPAYGGRAYSAYDGWPGGWDDEPEKKQGQYPVQKNLMAKNATSIQEEEDIEKVANQLYAEYMQEGYGM